MDIFYIYFLKEKLCISRSTVTRTIQKYQETGGFQDGPKSGRPKLLNSRDERSLIKHISKSPFSSASELNQKFVSLLGVNCSDRTIRNYLVRNGYNSYKAVKKPYLSSTHKAKRLEFCSIYENANSEFWDSVLFSDETRIQLHIGDKPALVRRPKNTSLDENYLKPTEKHPISIMIWGCFCSQGTGKIKIIEKTLNSDGYIRILEEQMLPSSEKFFNSNFIFQDDNAPCHKSKKVESWIERNNITRMVWPSQSPDLNPIENLWSILKRKIIKKMPQNKSELIKFTKEVWENEIPQEFIQNLVKSMNKRIKLVLENKGGHIPY